MCFYFVLFFPLEPPPLKSTTWQSSRPTALSFLGRCGSLQVFDLLDQIVFLIAELLVLRSIRLEVAKELHELGLVLQKDVHHGLSLVGVCNKYLWKDYVKSLSTICGCNAQSPVNQLLAKVLHCSCDGSSCSALIMNQFSSCCRFWLGSVIPSSEQIKDTFASCSPTRRSWSPPDWPTARQEDSKEKQLNDTKDWHNRKLDKYPASSKNERWSC